MKKIKILIVDDQQEVRKGIITLLEVESDMEISGEATDGVEAIEKIKIYHPDIVLLDISMPNMNGLETASYIQKNYKMVKSLIFSMHNDEDYIVKAVENGAWGYLLKDCSKEGLLTALRKIAAGEKYFGNQVSGILVERLIQKSKNPTTQKEDFKISKKEKVILSDIVNGLCSREIAQKLALSVRTVDNHRAHLMKKTNVKNSIELVKLAMKNGLI